MNDKNHAAIAVGCTDAVVSRINVELEDLGEVLEFEFPDTRAAVEHLLGSLKPGRVFLFHLKSEDDLAALKQLADVFSANAIIVLVEGGNPTLAFAANRHGATQAVALPIDHEDFRAAWKGVSVPFRTGLPPGEVIAVAGVTGGCGATAIASNLAYELAHIRDGDCILVELSLQLGKLANYFDVEPEFTTQDLFKNIDELDTPKVEKALARIGNHFSILSGPYRTLTPFSVSTDEVRRLIHYTRKLASVVVLDVPCTLDDHYFDILTAADRVVLVAEQKIPSLRSLKLVCDAIDGQTPVRPRTLVINRYNPNLPGLSVKKLEEVLKTSGFETIRNDFASMNATLDHGRPLRVEFPRSRALADIAGLARVLFPDIVIKTNGAHGVPFFSHLSRRLGLTKVGR